MELNTKLKSKKNLLVAAGIFSLPVIAIVALLLNIMQRSEGGNPKTKEASQFNTHLPSPNLPKTDKNKLEIYMQAQEDSLRHKREMENDPNVNPKTTTNPVQPFTRTPADPADTNLGRSLKNVRIKSLYEDENEAKVNERTKKLYSILQSGYPEGNAKKEITNSDVLALQDDRTAKLQRLMAEIQAKDTSSDPKMIQINNVLEKGNTVLDKLMAIQHPERVSQSISSSSGTNKTYWVSSQPETSRSEDSNNIETYGQNGFYGLTDDFDSTENMSTSIEAVIHTTQTVTSGAIVKLRLLQDIYLGTTRIPANSFIYGPCSVNGERVTIQLSNAICNDRIYPVQLKVFDGTDGLEGVYVPGAISRDVVKENMGQSVSGLNLTTLDPSIGAQAAAAGIETAKNLMSRKIRLVKVTLKAGHVVILKNPDSMH